MVFFVRKFYTADSIFKIDRLFQFSFLTECAAVVVSFKGFVHSFYPFVGLLAMVPWCVVY